MSDAPFNAAEVGLAIARVLEARGLPYALGGALAYGVWALPRATKDVDLNLFLDLAQLASGLEGRSGDEMGRVVRFVLAGLSHAPPLDWERRTA